MNATTAKTAAIASSPVEASISGTLATLLGLPPDAAPFAPDDHCEEAAKELDSEEPPGRLDRPPIASTFVAEIAKKAVATSERDIKFEKFKLGPPNFGA